jgi:hypothetical protein
MKSLFSKFIILSIALSLPIAGTGIWQTKSSNIKPETTETAPSWGRRLLDSPVTVWQWVRGFFVKEEEKPKTEESNKEEEEKIKKEQEEKIKQQEEQKKIEQKREEEERRKQEDEKKRKEEDEQRRKKEEEKRKQEEEQKIREEQKKKEEEKKKIEEKKEITKDEFKEIEKKIALYIEKKNYTEACNELKKYKIPARNYGPTLVNSGNNLLHFAALSPDNEMFKCFVDVYGRDHLDTQNNKGQTPVYLAVEYQNKDAIQHLLSFKPDVDAMTKQKDTALNYAIGRGKTDVVELLINAKANPIIQNNYNQDALGALRDYEKVQNNEDLHTLVTKYYDEYTKKTFGSFENINNYMKQATVKSFRKDSKDLLDSLNTISSTLNNQGGSGGMNYTHKSQTIYSYINLLFNYIFGAQTLINENDSSGLIKAQKYLDNLRKKNLYIPPLIADIINNLTKNVILKYSPGEHPEVPSVDPEEQVQIQNGFEFITAEIWLYVNNPMGTSFENIVDRTIKLCKQVKDKVQNKQMKSDVEFILAELEKLPKPFTKKALMQAGTTFQSHSALYPSNESPVTRETATALLAALQKAAIDKKYK